MAKIIYTPTAYSKDLSAFALTEEQANSLITSAENNPEASPDALLAGAGNDDIIKQFSAQEMAIKAEADRKKLTEYQLANQSWLETAAKNVSRPLFEALNAPWEIIHNVARGYSNNIQQGNYEYNIFDQQDWENTINSTGWGQIIEEAWRAFYADEAYGESKEIEGLGTDWFVSDSEQIQKDKRDLQAQMIGYNNYEEAKEELGGISVGQVATQNIENNPLLKNILSTTIDTTLIGLELIGITNVPAAIGKVNKLSKFAINPAAKAKATSVATTAGKLIDDSRQSFKASPELTQEARNVIFASDLSEARKMDLINDLDNEGLGFSDTLTKFADELNLEAKSNHTNVRKANEREEVLIASDAPAKKVAKTKQVKEQAQIKKAEVEANIERLPLIKQRNIKKLDDEINVLQKEITAAKKNKVARAEIVKLEKEVAIRQSRRNALIPDNVDVEIPKPYSLVKETKNVDIDNVSDVNTVGKLDGVNSVVDILQKQYYDEMLEAANKIKNNYSIAGNVGNPIEYLKDIIGLRRGLGDEDKVNLDAALNFFTGKHMNGNAEAILLINKAKNPLAKLRKFIGNALPLEYQRLLVEAKTVDDVKSVFAQAISKGDLTVTDAKLRVLRRAATIIDPLTGERRLISDYTKIIDKLNYVYTRTTIWGKQAHDLKVPWAIDANPEDADAMVELIYSMIQFTTASFRAPWKKINIQARTANVKAAKGKKSKLEALINSEPRFDGMEGSSWREFQEEYMERMMRAGSSDERRKIFLEAQEEMTVLAARIHNLDEADAKLFVNSFKKSLAYQNKMRAFLTTARADNLTNKQFDEALRNAGDEFAKSNLTELSIIAEEHLSQKLFMVDPYEMRKALATGKSLKEHWKRGGIIGDVATITDLIGTVYDKMFRRLILLRLGYVIRNINETQLRMFFTGHPTYMTNPFLLMSLLVNPNKKMGKIIAKARKGGTDVNGNPFIKDIDPEDINDAEYMREDIFYKTTNRNASLLDPGAFDSTAIKLGYEVVNISEPEYVFGLAHKILRVSSSQINRDVLSVIANRSLSKRITTWAKKNNREDLLPEDLLVEYYWVGPGSEIINDLRKTNNGANRSLYESKEAIRDYLFGNSPASRKVELQNVTDNFDTEFIDIILEAKYKKYEKVIDKATGKKIEILTDDVDIYPRIPGDKSATVKPIKPVVGAKKVLKGETVRTQQIKATERLINRKLGERIRNNPEQLPIQDVVTPKFLQGVNAGKAGTEEATGMFDWATDAVFNTSSYFERKFALEPEYMYSYWDSVNNYVSALSPEDAAIMLKNAEKALKSVPFTWSQKTLNKIKAAAKKANGDGNFTLDDLDYAAHRQGAKATERAFYDAGKRNAFGHSLRFIDPFAQAYGNTAKTFSRLAAKAPQRVYLWEKTINALQSENSGWIYDTWLYGEDDYDSSKPFIFTDPNTGEKVFGVPTMFAAIPGLLSTGDPQATDLVMNFDSTNVVTMNGLYPGVSPFIQIPYNFMMTTGLGTVMPTWLGDWISPVGGKAEVPSFFDFVSPAWAKEIGAAVITYFGGDSQRINKYLFGAYAQAAINNPNKYEMDETGLYYTEVGLKQLEKDAKDIAAGMALGKGFNMIFAIGSVDVKAKIKDYNGEYHLQSTIQAEFYDYMKNSGMNQEEAYQKLIDKYGSNVTFAMITGNKGSFAPRDAAWEAVQTNPELLKYANELTYFYPSGGYSVELARFKPQDSKYTIAELNEQVNNILYNSEISELKRLRVMGQQGNPNGITEQEYKERKRAVEFTWDRAPKLQYNYDVKKQEQAAVENALKQNPELLETDAGKAASIYFEHYNKLVNPSMPDLQTDALLSSGMTVKQELLLLGNYLSTQYPDFVIVWEDVLKSQVTPDK